jgi:quinol monooxygenase YgiN
MDQMNQLATAADSQEVIVLLTLHFKPGAAEKVLEHMIPSVVLTRAEAGNREFQLLKVTGSEDTFLVLERWENQAALAWHWQQPYTKETLALFAEHLAEPFSEANNVVHLMDMMKQ